MDRVILPDCCEDWILEYGPFYRPGQEFSCIECSGRWRKIKPSRYLSLSTECEWEERQRTEEGRTYRYLFTEEGDNPITDRCCAVLILDHHKRIRVGKTFSCPICGTEWTKERMNAGPSASYKVDGYRNVKKGIELAVEMHDGRGLRNQLVPIDEYVPESEGDW